MPSRTPPLPEVTLSWRDLWRTNSFAQADLTWDTQFGSRAKERGLRFGMGNGPFEYLDEVGAFQPIAFAAGGAQVEYIDPTPLESRMFFREEHAFRPWSEYAWDAHGHPHTSAMYSPWQMLYTDDVIDRASEPLKISLWVRPGDVLLDALAPLSPLASQLHQYWQALDAAWTPLMKLLVAIQDRYLPVVTGTTSLLIDNETGERVDPRPVERTNFDAIAAADELGLAAADITQAYWFLVERGIDCEPQDDLELLRRARPRSSHRQWRGKVRHAQDHYDAAAMLRLFLEDLTGEQPSRVRDWPMDGRQAFRTALYEHGPVPRLTRERLRRDLIEAGLYPYAVHVVGEGKSEKEMVTTLVAGFLGTSVANELGFTDLGGSGSASRLPTMVSGFTTYARRTVLIVDTEGKMAEYVRGLERSQTLPSEDVLRFGHNLEDSNFTPDELIDVLINLAGSGSRGLLKVTLMITVKDLSDAYESACAASHQTPGQAGVLLRLAQDPEFGGPYVVSKPDFAVALAERILDELRQTSTPEAHAALCVRRPLLDFVMSCILQPMAGPP